MEKSEKMEIFHIFIDGNHFQGCIPEESNIIQINS